MPSDKTDLNALEGRLAQVESAVSRLESAISRLAEEAHVLKRGVTTYLGDGVALTHLADESPMFVNSTGSVSPVNLIRQGVWEEDNLDVLLSYLEPQFLCLDIGANLGFFTLKMAQRLRSPGKVMAFEPHPRLCELMGRTVFHNVLRHVVEIRREALSDHNGRIQLNFPTYDLGGGQVSAPLTSAKSRLMRLAAKLRGRPIPSPKTISEVGPVTRVNAPMRRLDSVLKPGTAVNLVKIDVEGHEAQVLKGMKRVISESPDIRILLEKLETHAQSEETIATFLDDLGLDIYAIHANRRLEKLTLEGFKDWSGYVMAARPSAVGLMDRAFFYIYPGQLSYSPQLAEAARAWRPVLQVEQDGQDLFYGPYWGLPAGAWRLTLWGAITGQVRLSVTERAGRHVVDKILTNEDRSIEFRTDRDLVQFECVARAAGGPARLEFERLEMHRIG